MTKANDSITLACQLGAKRVPEYPISSLAEHAYHLSELLNILHGESSMQISTRQYHSNKFLMAVNLEKLNGTGASFSGINSKDSLLTVDVKGATAATACYVTLLYGAVYNIGQAGVELLE